MSVLAVSPIPRPTRVLAKVLVACGWHQMIRVAARFVLAYVVQLFAFWNDANKKLIRDTMGRAVASVRFDGAVAVSLPPGINPTAGGDVANYARQQSLFNGLRSHATI